MSTKVEEEEANWTKAISGLAITKCGLILSINTSLKNFLRSFSPEQIDHLSEFFGNTQDSNLEFKTEKGQKCWKIYKHCCQTGICQTILDLLWEKHVNKSRKVVWNPIVKESKLHTLNEKKVTLPFTHFFNKECSVCGKSDCPYERNRCGIPLFDDTSQQGDVDKYYWKIANMYMFHGKETINFPNTGPEDTDVALIFKLLKNCKLFSLDNDTDIDYEIYDDLLEVRNLLMHNADNRLSDEALEECFERMKSILKANMFSSEYSKNAITELEKLKDMRIIMTSLTSEELAIVQGAFKSQQSSLVFDIKFKGSLKNDYVLEGILKASKEKSTKYGNKTPQTPAPPSQTPASQTPAPPSQTPASQIPVPGQNYTGTKAGSVAGAVAGTLAGPPGMIVGATIGGFIGRLFD